MFRILNIKCKGAYLDLISDSVAFAHLFVVLGHEVELLL